MTRNQTILLGALLASLAIGSVVAWAEMSSTTDNKLKLALHTDGTASVAAENFIAVMGDDGTNLQSIQVDTAGNLQVDVLTSALPAGAATEATLLLVEGDTSAIQTAVQIMDDWDETNRAAVNLVAGQVAITAGAGAVGLNTPRMTLASDDPAVVDLAALEVLSTAANVDLAALEVLVTAGNVDLAALEVLDTSIEADTTAIQTAVQIMDDWDETNRAAVNLVSGQTGVAADQGVPGADVLRVVETQPNGATTTMLDPDQSEVAADIAANASRASIMCQNVGTTAVRWRIGAATGGTTGAILGAGAAANDGLGGSFSSSTTASLYLYDISGAGNADTACVEETW